MIQNLHIQNYALIDNLEIDFNNGFSVITGETGAGKSIILGAIGLLLGQRADSKSIKTGASRCIIEATFDLSNYMLDNFFADNDLDFDGCECIVRREVTDAGKSRAFINDTPVNVQALKELGDNLIDIHSQHQNLLLNKEDFQLKVLDIMGDNKDLLTTYSSIYTNYKQSIRQLDELVQQQEREQNELDYLQFQYNQLEQASLINGEEEELERELQTLEHAEEIKSTLFNVDALFEGENTNLLDMLKDAERQLSAIIRVYSKAEPIIERLESCHIELKDIASEIANYTDSIDYDPERLEEVNDRLSLIYELEKKHNVDNIKELLDIQSNLEGRLNNIIGGDEKIEELKKKIALLEKELTNLSDKLTSSRLSSAKTVEHEMLNRLTALGMPNVQFNVELTSTKNFEASGRDKVCFLFCGNKGTALQPISQVASGGEIARVMLSLKAMISSAVKLPTIIFDEIDTGVSGQIAEKMATTMKEMGKQHGRQVISITHLPQIAAMGTAHYRVFKQEENDVTISRITRLTEEERITEIAHMLSGSNLTDAAIENAKTLLKMSQE